jgi:hypothetical protein
MKARARSEIAVALRNMMGIAAAVTLNRLMARFRLHGP